MATRAESLVFLPALLATLVVIAPCRADEPIDYCSVPQTIVAGIDCNNTPPNVVCVRSGDVEDLYNQVNNPANHDKIVFLQAGTYTLDSANAAAGNTFSGALVMQTGMSLIGENRYSDDDARGVHSSVVGTETVIDASTSAFSPGPVATEDCVGNTFSGALAAVNLGHQGCVANVTVKTGGGNIGMNAPDSRILPSPAPSVGLEGSISDSLVTGDTSSVATGLGHLGCAEQGLNSGFTFLRNIVTGHNNGLYISNTLLDSTDAAQTTLRVTMKKNWFLYNTSTALVVQGGQWGTKNATTIARSEGNIFENNARGMHLTGGSTNTIVAPSSDDTLCFISINDQIIHNVQPAATPGVLVNGESLGGGFPAGFTWTGPIGSDNLARTYFFGSLFENNQRGSLSDNSLVTDIAALGGSVSDRATGGDRNRAELALFDNVNAVEDDYNATTGALKVPAWEPNTPYSVGNAVTSSGNHYECAQAGTSADTGPTSTDSDILDGTVHWRYYQGSSTFLKTNPIANATSDPDTNQAIVLSMPVPFFFPANATGTTLDGTNLIVEQPDGTLQIASVPTAPPPFRVTCPADPPPVEATGPSGAQVTFVNATAALGSDHRCEGVPVTCSTATGDIVASGSTFPIAQTQVRCTLFSTAAANDHCTFTVTVQAPRHRWVKPHKGT